MIRHIRQCLFCHYFHYLKITWLLFTLPFSSCTTKIYIQRLCQSCSSPFKLLFYFIYLFFTFFWTVWISASLPGLSCRKHTHTNIVITAHENITETKSKQIKFTFLTKCWWIFLLFSEWSGSQFLSRSSPIQRERNGHCKQNIRIMLIHWSNVVRSAALHESQDTQTNISLPSWVDSLTLVPSLLSLAAEQHQHKILYQVVVTYT